ncbi:MAG TPA: beta-ketoacyl-ACP synthase III [Polyangiaceae bacterium]|nr:beta-ketoacyl-ACP synthase III [Polyangiaceae bacterium]
MTPPAASRLRARVLGTGHYLPPTVRTNQDIERLVETSDAWISERTGIRQRRLAADGVTTSEMGAFAAKAALEMAGVDPREIDLIVVATVTADMPMPSAAALVQHKIGARACPAFDVGAACAGFVFALTVAEQFVRSGKSRRALVVGGDTLTKFLDWTDRKTCVLFGDGAGAVLLGADRAVDAEGRARGVLSTTLSTDGSLVPALHIPGGGSAHPPTADTVQKGLHYIRMNGQEIFKHAVKNLVQASRAALQEAEMTAAGVDWVVAHQANKRILDQVAVRLETGPGKMLSNIDRVGNTSSASIPILLDESVRGGTIKEGDAVLMSALGAGISWGGAVVRM